MNQSMTTRAGAALLCAALAATCAVAQKIPQMEKILVLPKGSEVKVSGLTLPGGARAPEDTTVSLSWNDEGFKAVFESVDSAVTAGRMPGKDDGLWRDDCVLLFLDPGHSHDAAQSVDVTVSAAGGLRARKGGSASAFLDEHPPVVESTETGWRAAIFISWKELGHKPEPAEAWGMNLARIDHEGKTYANMKNMAWAPIEKTFEEIDLWGHVVFTEKDMGADSEGAKTAISSLRKFHNEMLSETFFPNTNNTVVLPRGSAVKLSDFSIKTTGELPRLQTAATLSWDAAGLEVVFDCEDDAVFAEDRERDDIKMWRDDCVYVWLDPGHTHDQEGAFIMLQMSASGALHDVRNGNVESNIAGLQSEAKATETGWRGRLLIPWSGLGMKEPPPGDAWGINLTRIDHPGETDYKRMENTSWIPNKLNNDTLLDRWGEIVFVDKDAAPDDPSRKKGLASVESVHEARRKAILGQD